MPWSCRCCGAQGSSARVLEAGAGAVVVGWCPENRKEEMQSQVSCSSLENNNLMCFIWIIIVCQGPARNQRIFVDKY